MSVFDQKGDQPVSIFSAYLGGDVKVIREVQPLSDLMTQRSVRRITSELQVLSESFAAGAVMVDFVRSRRSDAIVILCFLPATIARRGYDSVPMAQRLRQAAKVLAAMGYNDVTRHPEPKIRIPLPAMPSPHYGLAGASHECRSPVAAASQARALLGMGQVVWRIDQDLPWSRKKDPITQVTQDDADYFLESLDEDL